MGFPKRKESGADFDNSSDEPFIPESHHLAVNDFCERSTTDKSHHQPKRLRESEKKLKKVSGLNCGWTRAVGQETVRRLFIRSSALPSVGSPNRTDRVAL